MRAHRWWGAGVLLAMVAVLSLAGCAGSGSSTGQVATPTTSTTTPTPTPSPASGSPTASATAQTCAATSNSARLGDLAITAPTVLYGFNADYMLPDTLPTDKPLAVTIQDGRGYVLGSLIESRPVIQGAFLISICNTSATQTHTLTSFGVTLDSAKPYSGHLNALNACAFLYGRSGGKGGECASGYSPDLSLTFHLPDSATPGNSVTQRPNSPVQLAPGQSLGVSIAIAPPSSSAITTYRLGLGVDGAAVAYPATLITQPSVNAPIARHWSGSTCTTAQMQAQIPATSPDNTYYVCP